MGQDSQRRHGRTDDELDPEILRFVRTMAESWAAHPELATASPAEARRIAEAVRAPWTAGGPRMATVSEHQLPTARGPVRLRRYDPSARADQPALIYLHGGGWTLFSLDTHDRLMREYAGRAGLVVLGVDYALSPEAKFPVALEQCTEVLRLVRRRRHELGIDPRRVGVGGDSAGANLALASCIRLRDEAPELVPDAMLLNYGVFDRHPTPAARQRYGGPGNMLTHEEMEEFWRNYLSSEAEAEDPLVCPIRARLAGLPPALLVVPECDLLAEQSLKMAEALRRAGVPVTLECYPGATHSFLEAVSIAAVAERALADSAAWLSAQLVARSL